MPDNKRGMFCTQCGSTMTTDNEVHIIPKGKRRGDDITVFSPENGRLVRLFHCQNQECLSIEVKALVPACV